MSTSRALLETAKNLIVLAVVLIGGMALMEAVVGGCVGKPKQPPPVTASAKRDNSGDTVLRAQLGETQRKLSEHDERVAEDIAGGLLGDVARKMKKDAEAKKLPD